MITRCRSFGRIPIPSCRGGFVPDIKGRVLLDTLASVKEREKESGLARIVEGLSEKSKKIFESPILFSDWYPLDSFTEFLEVNVRETANGNCEVLAKRSEKVVESHLRGVYRIFIRLGSPKFVITRISGVHQAYFKGVKIVPDVNGNRATIRYFGFQKQHSILEHTIIGFFRKALEISGANRIDLSFTVPIAQAGPYSELTIEWE
jgi:hypothetical protein